MKPVLFAKANVKGHLRDGKWIGPYTTKAPSAKAEAPKAGLQWSLFGGPATPGGKVAVKPPKPQPKAYHPKKGEDGGKVGIYHPSEATSEDTWRDPQAVATWVPGGDVPLALNGVEFSRWEDHPRTLEGWDYVEGQMEDLDEPPMKLPHGKQPASGVIVEEPDGRIWVVHPTNQFAGYKATLPKGGAEVGLSLQSNAIKEAFEEAGLKVEITGLFGDFERGTTVARYYTARRVGGTPADMGWESQAVSLVPRQKLYSLFNGAADKPIAVALGSEPADGDPVPMDDWEQVGKQEGSNDGGWFEDDDGVEWYCKFPQTGAHARNEVLAARLYEAVGVHVPELKLVSRDGKTGVASRKIDGLEKDPDGLADGAVGGVVEGFAADAWLANWDVVGLVYDNLLVDPDGQAVRVDTGGALIFRAQGSPKGAAFGDTVAEIESLRSEKNKTASRAFAGVTDEDIAHGVARIAALSDDHIRRIVGTWGPGSEAQRSSLADRLIARKSDLVNRFLFF